MVVTGGGADALPKLLLEAGVLSMGEDLAELGLDLDEVVSRARGGEGAVRLAALQPALGLLPVRRRRHLSLSLCLPPLQVGVPSREPEVAHNL